MKKNEAKKIYDDIIKMVDDKTGENDLLYPTEKTDIPLRMTFKKFINEVKKINRKWTYQATWESYVTYLEKMPIRERWSVYIEIGKNHTKDKNLYVGVVDFASPTTRGGARNFYLDERPIKKQDRFKINLSKKLKNFTY